MERDKVSGGDIAKMFGQGAKWKIIADANGLTETSILKIGAKLYIPPLDEAPEPELPVLPDDGFR